MGNVSERTSIKTRKFVRYSHFTTRGAANASV